MMRLLFPSMSNGHAPLSYELGVAILLAWVGESLYRIESVISRYPADFWLWRVIDYYDIEKIMPWYCLTAAGMICLGILRRICGCSSGRVLRAIGLLMAAALFLLVAVGHLSVTFYSIGGAPYLFLAWRFLELAIFYVRKA